MPDVAAGVRAEEQTHLQIRILIFCTYYSTRCSVCVCACSACVCVCVCVHVDLIILVFVSGVEWISVCVQLDVHTYLLYLLDAVRVCAYAHVRACDCVCVRMLI